MGVTEDLVTRAFGCGYGYRRYGNQCIRRSGWYSWGRWVVVGIILVILALSFICCLFTARRRRRRGVKPYYGTGWLANNQKWNQNQNDPNNYNMNQNYNQQQAGYGGYNPPPAYGTQQPQYTGSTFNPNDGYYGQQSGVQSPPAAYRGNDNFAPPPGPPPGK